MGVLKFYGGWVKNTFPEVVSNRLPTGDDVFLETLEFDMGGLLHASAAAVYCYGDGYNKRRRPTVEKMLSSKEGSDQLVRMFNNTVTDKIESLVKEFIEEVNPKYRRVVNLVVAMDGVAPFAKIVQQRTRRYKSAYSGAKSEFKEAKRRYKQDEFVPPPTGFQSNSITPGTKMMEQFDNHMKLWITSDEAVNLAQNKIIFSSYLSRGEGEHKLFSFRRDGRYEPRNDKGIIGVYGLDADLIILNALSPEERVFLIRERGKYTRKNEGYGSHAGILDVDYFKEKLVEAMTGIEDVIEIDNENYYSYIRDFVLMTFFVGNDFLPHIMAMGDIVKSINLMIDTYKTKVYVVDDDDEDRDFGEPKMGHITRDDSSIIWKNLLIILKNLSEEEEYLLGEMAKNMKKDKKNTAILNNSETLTESIKVENFEEDDKYQARREYKFDYDKFRSLWYHKSLGPRTPEMREFIESKGIESVSVEGIEEMCSNYITGLQWNISYYTIGTYKVSTTWNYIHTQAPLLGDLFNVCSGFIDSDTTPKTYTVKFDRAEPKFGPIHQLLSVLPPKSFNLINGVYSSELMVDKIKVGKLSDIAPIKFRVDYESAEAEHQGLAILPSVSPWRVVDVVSKIGKKGKANKFQLGTSEDQLFEIDTAQSTPIIFEKKPNDRRRPERRSANQNNRGRTSKKKYSNQKRSNRKRASRKKPQPRKRPNNDPNAVYIE
jgi:5'-3' exonuclease